MSAPPIGMMIRTPSARVSRTISQKVVPSWSTQNQATSSTVTTPRMAFSGCWPVKVIGAPLMTPCSLAKAMTDPVKVIAPMAAPIDISIRLLTWMSPGVPMP